MYLTATEIVLKLFSTVVKLLQFLLKLVPDLLTIKLSNKVN